MLRMSLASGRIVYILCVLLGLARPMNAKQASPFENILVPAGAEVMILTRTDISSNTVFTGDRLNFEVALDVIVNGRVAIAKGALVEAVVTEAAPRKSFGRGGRLRIDVETVTAVDGQKIKLLSAVKEQGGGRKGMLAIITVLGGPGGAGIFGGELKGANARIKAGMEIKALTAEEKAVSVVSGQSPTQAQDKNPKEPPLK